MSVVKSPVEIRFVLALALLGVAGCAPPSLTEAPDVGDTEFGDANDQVTFSQVASIIRTECAKPGCHAAGMNGGNAGLAIEGGQRATSEQIQKALEGQTVEGESVRFVEPGRPGESAIFQALTAQDGRVRMPLGGRLEGEKIETIRRWISRGAQYE